MKKGEKPPNLSQAWWNKNKPKTLKSTGLGKALDKYEKLRAGKPSLAYFKECLKELNSLGNAVDKAVKMCNSKLHGDTIEGLKGYEKLMKAELVAINKEETTYCKKLSTYKTSREKLIKELTGILKEQDTHSKKAAALLKMLNEQFKSNDKAANKTLESLQEEVRQSNLQAEKAIAACDPWRKGESPYSGTGLHVDDRDDAGGKTLPIINKQMQTVESTKTDVARVLQAAEKLAKG